MLTPLDQPTRRGAVLTTIGVVVLVLGLILTPAGPALADQMRPMLTKIVNTSAEPVPVKDVEGASARQPVADGQRLVGLNQEHHTLLTVPDGKRLVIEFITVTCAVGSHLRPSANIFLTSDGEGNQHQIALTPVKTVGGVSTFQASHMVRLYADPGTPVKVFVGFSPDDPEWDDRIAAVSFSGYLVSV